MPKSLRLENDGSLTIIDDNGGAKNPDGTPALRSWSIQSAQIEAHRRDSAIDSMISAPDKIMLDAKSAKLAQR